MSGAVVSGAAATAIAKVRTTRRCRKGAIKPAPPMRTTKLAGGAGPDRQQHKGLGFSSPSWAAFPQRLWLPSRYIDGGTGPEAGPKSEERWRISPGGLMGRRSGPGGLPLPGKQVRIPRFQNADGLGLLTIMIIAGQEGS